MTNTGGALAGAPGVGLGVKRGIYLAGPFGKQVIQCCHRGTLWRFSASSSP